MGKGEFMVIHSYVLNRAGSRGEDIQLATSNGSVTKVL
jgi:hypothetical protein